MRIREALEIGANAAVILTCGFFLTLFAISYTKTAGAGSTAPPAARIVPYAIGDVLAPYSGLDLTAADRTLVLVFRSECRFCSDSMPFYRRVAERTTGVAKSQQFVGVTTDPIEKARTYLVANNLTLAQIASVNPVRVSGTPTLLLVDRSGKIQRIWRGRLGEPQESEVFAALAGTRAGM